MGTGDENQTILVVPDEKGTKMNMYALGTEKESIFKKDLVGDIFIKYESKTDEIVYLANLRPEKPPVNKKDQKKNLEAPKKESLIRLKLDEDPM